MRYLVGGLEHLDYFPFHIWDVILPIDELHHLSRWFFNHQPVKVLNPATSGAGISLIPLWMLHMLSMAAIRF